MGRAPFSASSRIWAPSSWELKLGWFPWKNWEERTKMVENNGGFMEFARKKGGFKLEHDGLHH